MLFMVKLAEKHFYMFIIKGLFQCLLVEVMFGAIKLIFVANIHYSDLNYQHR